MKHLFNYLVSKNITVKDFEDKATIVLDNNEWFIPFASSELMQHYNLSDMYKIEVDMVLAEILGKKYQFN